MAGFFHFLQANKNEIVAAKRIQHDALRAFGLDEVLADCEAWPDDVVITEIPFAHDHSGGPGGNAGLVLYPKNPLAADPPGWGYRPDHQEWRKVADRRWLGWEMLSPPTPEELERKEVFRDYSFQDGGGRKWSIPCARSPRPMISSLPVEYGFGTDGSLERKIVPKFQDLWKLSGEVLDAARGRTEPDEAWLVSAALRCLQVNYRIGPAEITALRDVGLAPLTDKSVWGILFSLIDQNLEQEAAETLLEKKTEIMTPTTSEGNGRYPPRSPNASNGPGDDSPDTHRAEAPSLSRECSTK